MRTDNQRRSSNIEDRRGMRGGGGGFRGGLPVSTRGMGLRGIVILGVVLLGVYFFAPPNIRDMVFSAVTGGGAGAPAQQAVDVGRCPADDQACDFVSVVLGSTEDVWAAQFQQGRLPNYGGAAPGSYQQPVLVLFEDMVATGGCGSAPSSVGPFYCPADNKLYIDLSFYDTLARRLNAPGDFAQAYVIAHEVGHHIQNLIGATQLRGQGDNESSVRLELQADCLAGVWGHHAQANLDISDADLREALGAAHAIGDDQLQRSQTGTVNPASFTHGTSEQRMRWFRTGFDSGDARRCDTFAVRDYSRL